MQLKCDEATPACNNCLRRGWQFPGYGKHIRWSAKHERFGALSLAPQASPSSGPPVQQALPQLYYNDWHFSGPDRPLAYSGSGPGDLNARLDQTSKDVSPPAQLPITPVSQQAFDDCNVVHDERPRSSATAPACDTNASEQSYDLAVYQAIDSRRSTNRTPASPAYSNASCDTGAQEMPFDPRIFYTPTHVPTILIEHWFSDVCPMWNIFDSDSNFNRQFASSSWSSSEPVFYAMQSMSAACLVDTLPAMMPVLSSLTTKALAAIRSRVSFYESKQCVVVSEFPTDLLFAIFAMGTSLHWKHGFELGGSLMKYAHSVMDRYKRRLPSMAPSERKDLAFFQKALICWEGILSAADSNFSPISFVIRRQAYQARIASRQFQPSSPQPSFGPPALSLSDAELHPWCGVSSDVLQKFGQVMTLCHLAQRRRFHAIEDGGLEMSCDLGLARELASELAVMDFTPKSQQSYTKHHHLRTNDNDTPLSHLLGIAEAYRQACFLQLCLTFEDLPIHDTAFFNLGLSPQAYSADLASHGMTRIQGLVGLSLQLVESLKKIPPESGSRCMQPLLYLCAASGLQFNPLSPLESNSTHSQAAAQGDIEHDQTGMYNRYLGGQGYDSDLGVVDTTLASTLDGSTAFTSQQPNIDQGLTLSAFKVAQARSFVKKRLGMLQQLLPPRYTGTALRLAEAIWAEYDCTSDGGSPLYWFDIMVRENLQTFFG